MSYPEFPAFLKRNPDNTFVDKKPWGKLTPLKTAVLVPPEDIAGWSDARLAAEMDTATVTERQPMIRERRRRDDKERARVRIAEMKARLAERGIE